jgi:hypothetical protein
MLRFGYQFLGPFLVDWYNRLAVAAEHEASDTIHMLGREGWGLVPLFNSIEAMRGAHRRRYVYLHASRALLTHISLSDPRYWDFGFGLRFTGTVRDFAEGRLCLHAELLDMPAVADQYVVLPRDTEYLRDLFGRSRGIVEAMATRSRDAYGRYLAQSGFAAGQTHIISDLGFRGSTQALLSALYGFNIKGYYAMLDPAGVPGAPPLAPGSVSGLFTDDKSFGEGYLPLDRSLLFEAFLTAPFGQVSGIQDVARGDPFLYREGQPAQKNYAILAECMQGAHKFAIDHRDLLGAREPLIDDFELFFESFHEAVVSDIREIRPILSIDDSYYGVHVNNAEAKL